jgi:hypothetical protein
MQARVMQRALRNRRANPVRDFGAFVNELLGEEIFQEAIDPLDVEELADLGGEVENQILMPDAPQATETRCQ